MATISVAQPQPRSAAPGRGGVLVAAFALFACAVAGGYALAVHEMQALWVGLAAVASIAIMVDYRAGAVLLILLLPISGTSLFPHALMGITGLNPINVLLGGTLVAYVLRGRFEHPAALIPRPLVWLLIVPIVIGGLLGTGHIDDMHPGFFEMVDYTDWRGYLRDVVVKPLFIPLAAVLVGAAVTKSRKPESFIVAIAIGACALAFLQFGYILVSGVRLGYLASPHARAFFQGVGAHANELGRVFVMAYALMLFTWWETKHDGSKLALFVVLGVLSFGVLFTFSRNAFLGFLLVNALFLAWKFNAKKLALAVLGTAIALAFAPAAVYRRLSYGFDSAGGANAVSAGRIEGIWQPLLPETLKSPLWGNGLDSIMWSHPMLTGAMEFVGHPHNAYLQALLDMGVIGLVLLLLYYWHVWKGFRALGGNAYLSPVMRGFFQGACAALIAFAVAGMSGGSLRPEPENMFLWIAIGMMYGLLARRPAS